MILLLVYRKNHDNKRNFINFIFNNCIILGFEETSTFHECLEVGLFGSNNEHYILKITKNFQF